MLSVVMPVRQASDELGRNVSCRAHTLKVSTAYRTVLARVRRLSGKVDPFGMRFAQDLALIVTIGLGSSVRTQHVWFMSPGGCVPLDKVFPDG